MDIKRLLGPEALSASYLAGFLIKGWNSSCPTCSKLLRDSGVQSVEFDDYTPEQTEAAIALIGAISKCAHTPPVPEYSKVKLTTHKPCNKCNTIVKRTEDTAYSDAYGVHKYWVCSNCGEVVK